MSVELTDVENPQDLENPTDVENGLEEENSPEDIRREEPWSDNAEKLMREFVHSVYVSHKKHELAGYYYKRLRKLWGLPCVLIPSVMAPITNVFAEYKNIQYVNTGAFILTAIFTGVDSFFSFNLRRERHFTYSARFGELHHEMQIEMIKKREFRMQSDLFMSRMQMRMDTLEGNAPVLPKFISNMEITYPDQYDNLLTSFEKVE